MRKVYLIIALLFAGFSLFAVPAKPGKFLYTQPDGSVIEIARHGDEWGHWTTNAAGKVVEMDSDGYYREVNDVTPQMAAQAASVRRNAMRQSRLSSGRAASASVTGKKHFLVILVQFSDLSFVTQNTQQAFYNMLNQKGYSYNDGTGSASDYYYENSHGAFEPVFDVYGPVTVSQKMSYYGGNNSSGNDKHPAEAVVEGCKALDSSINYADYDNDGDGYVDLVYMVYAGKGEADGGSDDTIWPHQWGLSSAGYSGNNRIKLDGKVLDGYACGAELNGEGSLTGIGTMCHEFGHAMGLPDFYDTDYATNGRTHAMSFFSLMDSGSYNNGGKTPPYLNMEERLIMGWVDESAIEEFSRNGSYTLPGVNDNKAYKILTDKEGEYFLLQCRDGNGWDSGIYGAVGLLVMHVDKSNRTVGSYTASDLWENWQYSNKINAYGSHPCCYVIPACDQSNLYYQPYYVSDVWAMLFPGHEDLDTKVRTYTPVSWSKINSDISLSDITYSNGQVSFNVSGVVSSGVDYPYISNPGDGNYTAGSSFNLEVVMPDGNDPYSVSWKMDGNAVNGTSVKLSSGGHKLVAAVTAANGKTYIVTLELKAK